MMRTFDSGATRDDDKEKIDPEGFLSVPALEAYFAYMHKHRKQADGSLRASDNWQKGMDLLAEIAEQCREHDVPLVILLMPSKKELAWSDGTRTRATHRDVTDGAVQCGAVVVDLSPKLRELGTDTAYFANDPHINVIGHRAVGHILAEAVRLCGTPGD